MSSLPRSGFPVTRIDALTPYIYIKIYSYPAFFGRGMKGSDRGHVGNTIAVGYVNELS